MVCSEATSLHNGAFMKQGAGTLTAADASGKAAPEAARLLKLLL